MLIDLIWSAHTAWLVVLTAAYAVALLWLLAHDVERRRFHRRARRDRRRR